MKKNLKNILIVMLLIIIPPILMYICLFTEFLTSIFFQEKFLIKYSIFNLFFLLNVLLAMSTKVSKFSFYCVYCLQIIILFYFNRNLYSILDPDDILTIFGIVYLLLLFGYAFLEKVKSWAAIKYEKGIIRQDKFFKEKVSKNYLLNNILFFRNIIILNLGSNKIPNKNSFLFWILYSIFTFIVTYLCFITAFKTLFAISLFILSVDAKYVSLQANYKDSVEFKKNFDDNYNFWLKKFSSNQPSKLGLVQKRFYSGTSAEVAKETLKIGFDNLNYTHTNPITRTLVWVGGIALFSATFAVFGSAYNTHKHETELTKRVTISEETKRGINIQEEENKRKEKIQEEETKRLKKIQKEKSRRLQLKLSHERELEKNKSILERIFGGKK